MTDIEARLVKMLPITINLAAALLACTVAEVEDAANELRRKRLVAVRVCTLTGRSVVVDRRRQPPGVPQAAEPAPSQTSAVRRRGSGNGARYHQYSITRELGTWSERRKRKETVDA